LLPPLSNPPWIIGRHRRKSPETSPIYPTAAAPIFNLGFLFSGQIGRKILRDLEAPAQANPAPPTPCQSVVGRRRIVEICIPAAVSYFSNFRSPLICFDLSDSYEKCCC
jgi:hypothetical protein